MKALWETVQEQTVQEISYAVWGQVFIIYLKIKTTFKEVIVLRLVWTLPGKTKIVCHLKDKKKIRNKKRFLGKCEMPHWFLLRWSQIMYMYYLLGYKIMELPISDERKEVRSRGRV